MKLAHHSHPSVRTANIAWLLCTSWALSACGGGGAEPAASNANPPPPTAGQTTMPMPALAVSSSDRPANDTLERVSFANGMLNVQARHGSLRSVLAAIEKQAGITIVVDPSIASVPMAGDVRAASLEDGLLQLLPGYDVLFAFAAQDRSRSLLQAVWVNARGQRAQNQPTAPTGTRIADADSAPADATAAADVPLGEEAAALQLLSTDPAVRRRALSRGLDRQYALPEDTLRQLAGTDADPDTRRLALIALARDPAANSANARTAAALALGDGDTAVRDQAKDLLEQFDLAAMPNDQLPQSSAPPPTP